MTDAAAAGPDEPRARLTAEVAAVRARLAEGFELLAADAPPPPPADPDEDLAPLVDHTLLQPTATDADVVRLCEEAARHGFGAVCVHGARLRTATTSCPPEVTVACVVDFPLGCGQTAARAREAALAVEAGASELDLVAPAGLLEQAIAADGAPGAGPDDPAWERGRLEAWVADVSAVVAAARDAGPCRVKLILETDRLTGTQTIAGALLAELAGVDMVKTSTGFGRGGATVEAVARMHAAVGGRLGVKASGGIASRSDALALRAAGATRFGTSRSLALLAD